MVILTRILARQFSLRLELGNDDGDGGGGGWMDSLHGI